MNTNHETGHLRAFLYVRNSVAQAVIDIADVVDEGIECAAVTVRIGHFDTSIASVYVRPDIPWDARKVQVLSTHLGRDSIICGDFNAHHFEWGSKRCTRRGKELLDALPGYLVLNTGETTFVRRNGIHTTIDVTFVTSGCAYQWSTAPNTW